MTCSKDNFIITLDPKDVVKPGHVSHREIAQKLKENNEFVIIKDGERINKRMESIACQIKKEQINMKQSFSISDQGPSHSEAPVNHAKPQKLVHYKDPNFNRDKSILLAPNLGHNKRRSDCTVFVHDYLPVWTSSIHKTKFEPVLKRAKPMFSLSNITPTNNTFYTK